MSESAESGNQVSHVTILEDSNGERSIVDGTDPGLYRFDKEEGDFVKAYKKVATLKLPFPMPSHEITAFANSDEGHELFDPYFDEVAMA